MTALATGGQVWLQDLCRRMGSALGWELDYEPAAADDERLTAPEPLWTAEIHDGHEVTGKLHLRPARLETEEVDLGTTVAAAHVFADALSRLAAASRKLDSRSREVSTLVELGKSLPEGGNVSTALDRLLRAAAQLTGLWSAAFFLIHPQTQSFRLRSTYQLEPGQIPAPQRSLGESSPDGAALTNGLAILGRDDAGGGRWLPQGCSVGVCVTVQTAEGPLGTLWCYERRRRTVSEREIHALQSVAAQIAAVLERTVLLRESAARRKLRDELNAASVHHTGNAVCPLPLDCGVEAALRTARAAELGGDLCEVWPAGAMRTLVAVGDAVGHSIPAAMVMAVARGSLRTLLDEGVAELVQTDRIISRVNRALCTVTRAEQFMTMVCGVIDIQAMRFTYTNAGHPPPWIVRQGRHTPLESHGLLLGVLPEANYPRGHVDLEPGDVLICFTDGVSEAMSRQRQIFRTDGVLAAIGDAQRQSAAQTADAIWDRLCRHLEGHGPADDQTLLVIKIRP